MASRNTEQSAGSISASPNATSSQCPPAMHPELLMAACQGYYGQLDLLLNREDTEVIVNVDGSTEYAASLLLQGATPDGDSALHIVASSGDGDRYVKSAEVIYSRAKHLLAARNGRGSTPLHCAARAGNFAVLSLFIDLARREEEAGAVDSRIRTRTLLRMQNKPAGETALHEAIRAAHMPMVGELMTADDCLARVPSHDGTSPLFLAVSLRHHAIARELYKRDSQLSYSGPHGQNALHAAVLRSQVMNELLLGWNKDLVKQQDQQGNTPLHFAVSTESDYTGFFPRYIMPVDSGTSITPFLSVKEPPLDLTKQLLEADAHCAYQADKQGSYPIHIAASAGMLSAIIILVTRCSGCAGLRDNHGRTFLHIAVKKRRYHVVAYACRTPLLGSILNLQDNEGNTALHLAVEAGDWWTFAYLYANKHVALNLPNISRHTPRELSVRTIPTGVYCMLNSRILIQQALISANATRDICRLDGMEVDHNPEPDAGVDAQLTNSTQVTGIGLALVTTMAFGATFSLPGGYRADDHPNGGTPTLGTSNFFQGFLMANSLAVACSSLAVLSICFYGMPGYDYSMRCLHFNLSLWLGGNAVICFSISLVLAVYIILASVSLGTAIAIILALASVAIFYANSLLERYIILLIGILNRVGIVPILRSNIFKALFLLGWPVLVIFFCQEIYAWRHHTWI